MRLIGVVILGSFFLAISSCTENQKNFQVADLEGLWSDSKTGSHEEWIMVGDNHLKGKGFEVKGTDTIVFEILEIKKINGTLTYLADVEQAMGQGIVDFPLVSQSANGLVFINKEHDFPQVLSYEKISDDSLKVTVGTFPLLEDKDAMVLNYVRIK